jgi:hypothetical protein
MIPHLKTGHAAVARQVPQLQNTIVLDICAITVEITIFEYHQRLSEQKVLSVYILFCHPGGLSHKISRLSPLRISWIFLMDSE